MSRVKKSTLTREGRLARLGRVAASLGLEPEQGGPAGQLEFVKSDRSRAWRFSLASRTSVKIIAYVPTADGWQMETVLTVSDASAEQALLRIAGAA